jgi:hypothetical protein
MAPPNMVQDDQAAVCRNLGALVFVYFTMVTTHFPDDDMSRRNTVVGVTMGRSSCPGAPPPRFALLFCEGDQEKMFLDLNPPDGPFEPS